MTAAGAAAGGSAAAGAPRPRRVLPPAVGTLGALAILLVLGLDTLRARSLALDQELARRIDRVRIETMAAHLQLEELVAGSGEEPAAARRGFERARADAAALAAPAAAESAELAAGVARLSRELERLAAAAEARLARRSAGEAAGPGTAVDLAFGRQADLVLAAADELSGRVAVHSDRHQRRTERLRGAALAGWALLVLGAAWALAEHERRRAAAARALLESERRLLQAQKLEAVGRLAGGIAHDVNNVLATVRTNCELVLHKEMPRDRLARRMETVIDAVLRASSLVERLLTFARRQASRPERVDLGEVVEGFERLALGSLSGQRLEIEREPGLWPVEIDLAQAEQALANLFFNARDATPAGGTIRIAARNAPRADGRDEVCLEVSDTGVGIPRDVQDQIFEPFFTTKAGVGSSGLGLATVYAVVEQAGGRIELDSAPGRGARFRLILPRAAGAADRRAERGAAPSRGAGERLLVIEDEGDLRGAVAGLLETWGYRVTAVAGPAEALAAAREAAGGFDLVVSDVRLAEGTGPELVARLRELGPLRALYLSGYTDRIALRGGPGRGEAFFLKKPFSADGLARMVRELLDQPPPHAV